MTRIVFYHRMQPLYCNEPNFLICSNNIFKRFHYSPNQKENGEETDFSDILLMLATGIILRRILKVF